MGTDKKVTLAFCVEEFHKDVAFLVGGSEVEMWWAVRCHGNSAQLCVSWG